MNLHEKFISRCIELAKNGLGTTYPNPLVGSVIVYKGEIIGEGWHRAAGEPHAEVLAINSVKDHSLLKDATIYVNLEPCSHTGKTPPCSDLIISKGIKKVVIGSVDPNPKVSGEGIDRLKGAGCEVTVGIFKRASDELNKRFFTYHLKNRPFIFLKWAQSADGFIAPKNRDGQNPVWITNTYSRQLVHKMRAEEVAILVGTNTVMDDDPSLTTRDWQGSSPWRVVIDRSLRIPLSAKIFNSESKTIVITEKETAPIDTIYYATANFDHSLAAQICAILYRYKIQSLIVEGGARILQTFIDENLWDEAFVFESDMIFKEGVHPPIGLDDLSSETNLKGDRLKHFKNSIS